MATKSLTLAQIDRAHELIYKSRAIVGLIRSASTSPDPLPDESLPNSCWAVEGMLHELERILGGEAR